jgi:hypothetical protein
VRPRALWVAGFLTQVQGDIPAARALLETALSAARAAGDVRAEAWASSFLGWDLYFLGDRGQGHALAQAALRRHRESADRVGEVLALMQIGYIHLCADEPEQAAGWFGECARVREQRQRVVSGLRAVGAGRGGVAECRSRPRGHAGGHGAAHPAAHG